MMSFEHIIVIAIIILAIVGMIIAIRRQQREEPCDKSCAQCPLAEKCEKK